MRPPSRPSRLARRLSTALVGLLAALVTACGGEAADGGGDGETLVLGLVGKSQGNPVFQAAYVGAQAAARELGAERGIQIEIDWQTPPDEDPLRQAAAIEQLARAGVQGIAVSCSENATLTPAIDKAVELGSHVVCFDSDAPESGRFAFFGTDDRACGAQVMQELAAALDGQGTIAVLAGNQAARNLYERVQGVLEEAKNHPGITVLEDGVFYHEETPEVAAETVATAQSVHPEIDGWAMVGGWPLFTDGALRWEPGAVKVVSVDALPAQLKYLESGHVGVLLAQDCYAWGYRSVELLLDRILDGKSPDTPRVVDPLKPVHAEDVETVAAQWAGWLGEG